MRIKTALLALTVSIFVWIPTLAVAEIDSIYTNGKIYTVDVAQPWAEAFAIKDGKFHAVGKSGLTQVANGAAAIQIDADADNPIVQIAGLRPGRSGAQGACRSDPYDEDLSDHFREAAAPVSVPRVPHTLHFLMLLESSVKR